MLEGKRALHAMMIGLLYSGTAEWFWGQKGIPHLGASGLVMALMGVLIISLVRNKRAFYAPFLLIPLYYLFEQTIFDTIRPTAYAIANHISWSGHFGGLFGGFAAMVNSPSLALENLKDQKIISNDEFRQIRGRIDFDYDERKHDLSLEQHDAKETLSNQ